MIKEINPEKLLKPKNSIPSLKDRTVEICPQCHNGVAESMMKCPHCGYCIRCDF